MRDGTGTGTYRATARRSSDLRPAGRLTSERLRQNVGADVSRFTSPSMSSAVGDAQGWTNHTASTAGTYRSGRAPSSAGAASASPGWLLAGVHMLRRITLQGVDSARSTTREESVTVTIRDATPADATAVVGLIAELADSEEWPLELTEAYVPTYLAFPGTRVLLAEREGEAVGLLAYCVRPGLFHAGDIGYIDELVVASPARRTGVGTRLLQTAMGRMAEQGCREISLSTGSDNAEAQRLYRSLGLTEESLLLERHLPTK